MGQILRNWRVLGALSFAVAVIAGSYYLVTSVNMPAVAEASAETALLQAVAAKDSTGDGLPDWQKALYGIPIDATTTDYFHLGMTDGEAVAKGLIVPKAVVNGPAGTAATSTSGTLTDAFSQAFFSLYLSAKQANGGTNLTPDQTNALAEQAFNQFIQTATPTADYKKQDDLKVQGSGVAALEAFAANAEGVFSRYQTKSDTSEINLVQATLGGKDPVAAGKLSAVADTYRSYAAGLAALTVPKELASADIELINAFILRAALYDYFTNVNTDPLMAIVALQQLTANETGMRSAFGDVGSVYLSENAIPSAGTPGSGFVRLSIGFSPRP